RRSSSSSQRWASISRSSSPSARAGRRKLNSRRKKRSSSAMLGLGTEQPVHQAGQSPPALGLLLQGPDAGAGEPVVLGVAVVRRLLPVARDPPLLLEANQGRVERPL